MKPIKDLAEHLAKDARVNQRALERFNHCLEAIRCTVAQHRDYLNQLQNNAGSNPHLASLVINMEMFLEKMDNEAIVPSTPESRTSAPPIFANWSTDDLREGIQDGVIKESEVREYFRSLGLRRCNYCGQDTETKDEDCVACGLSKPFDPRKYVSRHI